MCGLRATHFYARPFQSHSELDLFAEVVHLQRIRERLGLAMARADEVLGTASLDREREAHLAFGGQQHVLAARAVRLVLDLIGQQTVQENSCFRSADADLFPVRGVEEDALLSCCGVLCGDGAHRQKERGLLRARHTGLTLSEEVKQSALGHVWVPPGRRSVRLVA